MARYRNSSDTCRHFGGINPNTLKNWAANAWITVYRTTDGAFAYDLDEIEAELARNPRMRDKRKPFGGGAKVVDLPSGVKVPKSIPRAEVVTSNTAAIS